MLLSLRKNGLTSLFKEVRVFKVALEQPMPQTEYEVCAKLGNGSGILFREYCFGRENSLSSAANSVSPAKNSVSSLCHTNNRLRGTH